MQSDMLDGTWQAKASAWLNLEKQAEEPLFSDDNPLELSASGIKTYMQCPRQFYYKHILRLPQQEHLSATLGSLTHRLMAVFNTQPRIESDYTAVHLHALMNCFLNFEEETIEGAPTAFFDAGFNTVDLEKLKSLPPLNLKSFKENLSASITDLETKGYFTRYKHPQAIEAELSLRQVIIPGLSGCTFTGQIDALIQDDQGLWDILDYKTSQGAYTTGVDTCDRHFQDLLAPLPDGEELSHTERFAPRLQTTYPKDYQLILYYLACSQDPRFQGKIQRVAWQLFRPVFPESPAQGAIQLGLSAEKIEEKKEILLADIQRYIVDPILKTTHFNAHPVVPICQQCSYRELCDANKTADDSSAE